MASNTLFSIGRGTPVRINRTTTVEKGGAEGNREARHDRVAGFFGGETVMLGDIWARGWAYNPFMTEARDRITAQNLFERVRYLLYGSRQQPQTQPSELSKQTCLSLTSLVRMSDDCPALSNSSFVTISP